MTATIATKTKKEAEVDLLHRIDIVVQVEDDNVKGENSSNKTGAHINASKTTIVVRKQRNRFRLNNRMHT